MLDGISKKLDEVFRKLSGKGRLSEKNITDGIREIKLALLEADVNYKVVKTFIEDITEKSLGEKVIKNVNPTEQLIKIVHDELIELMGDQQSELKIKPQGTTIIMLIGLQGSGKTTTCAKLAKRIKGEKRVLLVGADIYRPAAKEQLRILSQKVGVDYYTGDDAESPQKIVESALRVAREKDCSYVIIDTAGRLEIDEPLMKELKEIKKIAKPDEILFVSDSMAGQNITKVVTEFDAALEISGVILTKFDSDTRGGSALSIKKVTGKSIKFIGVGEKIEDLEIFHPDRIAGRILGMGDVVSLVEKAQEAVDMEEAARLEKKLRKQNFDLNDFLKQIQMMKKMGPLENIVKMIPGARNLPVEQVDNRKFKQFEAIILSMTKKERENYKIITGNRRRRIAMGSGTSTRDVNNLLKSFDQMYRMITNMVKNPNQIKKMMTQMKDAKLPF